MQRHLLALALALAPALALALAPELAPDPELGRLGITGSKIT
jgi:hypothetical protein